MPVLENLASMNAEKQRDLLRVCLLDQVIDHLFAEAARSGIPVPGADDEFIARLADEIMDAGAAAHLAEWRFQRRQ